jgi:hypothetical protein
MVFVKFMFAFLGYILFITFALIKIQTIVLHIPMDRGKL